MTNLDEDYEFWQLKIELLKRRLNFFMKERTKFRNALFDILCDLNAYAGTQNKMDPIQSIAKRLSCELENHIDFTAEVIAEHFAPMKSNHPSQKKLEETSITRGDVGSIGPSCS